GSDADFANLYPDLYQQYSNYQNSQLNKYSSTPYGYSQGTNWSRPGGDPNAAWLSGQSDPMAGVDQRVASQIYNPNPYQYGGRAGMAEDEYNGYMGYGNDARGQQANALAQYNYGVGLSDMARGQQMQAYNLTQGLANGTGPSAAQVQMNQGLAAARAQQASIAAGARGGAAGLVAAQQAGANQAGSLSANAVQQGALLRSQE